MWRKQTGQKHINSREHICLKCGYKQDRSGKQDCRDRLGSVGVMSEFWRLLLPPHRPARPLGFLRVTLVEGPHHLPVECRLCPVPELSAGPL